MANNLGTAAEEMGEEDIPLELVVDLSIDELAALTDLFEVESFPGAEEDLEAFNDLSQEVLEATLSTASRCLMARHIVHLIDPETGEVEVTQPHAGIFGTVLDPDAVITLDIELGDDQESRLLFCRPGLVVELSAPLPLIYRFYAVESEHLADVALGISEEGDGGGTDAAAFTVSVETLDEVERHLDAGDEAQALALAPEAGPFIRALMDGVRSTHLQCRYEEGEETVSGDLTWLDAGEHGLWLVEPELPANADEISHLVIKRVSADTLYAEFLSMVPAAMTAGSSAAEGPTQ